MNRLGTIIISYSSNVFLAHFRLKVELEVMIKKLIIHDRIWLDLTHLRPRPFAQWQNKSLVINFIVVYRVIKLYRK